jgi:hypothetical protein
MTDNAVSQRHPRVSEEDLLNLESSNTKTTRDGKRVYIFAIKILFQAK